MSSQKQKKFLQILSNNSALYGANSLKTSYYNGSQPKSYSGSESSSASSLADLNDITIVKEEPLSPHSSCPPSPNSNFSNTLPSISSINPDLMFDRKVRVHYYELFCNYDRYLNFKKYAFCSHC
jgi:hypothetical protein